VHRARPVSLGDLASTPFTDDWGFSRGLPVDRTYVEEFLAANAGEIRGRVLEIGDADYTARFGGDRVLRADVLDLRDHPGVTHVGDLQDAPMLEDGVYDCVVLTQVLVLIPDLARALATVQRILRPGGVALITNPGISQVSHDPSEAAAWHWALYPRSLQRLLVGAGFPAKTIEIGSWGNLKATVAFLAGLASSDLEPAELSFRDPRYPLLVSAKAVKSPRSAAAGASTH
jgi:SAM-dependent methyltransferase